MFFLQGNVEGLQDSGETGAPLELCGLDVTDFSKQMPVVWSAGKNRRLVAAGFWFQKSSAVFHTEHNRNVCFKGKSFLHKEYGYRSGLVWRNTHSSFTNFLKAIEI